jgi:hypothetical protein
MAMDEDAALAMCMAYEETNTIAGWNHLQFAHGVDHEAIKAKARHMKRWPHGMPLATRGHPL